MTEEEFSKAIKYINNGLKLPYSQGIKPSGAYRESYPNESYESYLCDA